jgi:kinesin family protein C2/C3
MQGSHGNEGVSFRALRTLLESGDSVSRSTELTLCAVEIHRESIYDLLSGSLPAADIRPKDDKLDLRVGAEGVHVAGLSQHKLTSVAQAMQLLSAAAAARAQARTDMNEVSSRSHCVVTVSAVTTNMVTGQRATG